MSINATNYRDIMSKPDLTAILGIPTYDSLHKMQIELKTNAISVHSNKGGGSHGHLGLIMTGPQFALLSNVAYIKDPHPGELVIPQNATRVAAEAQKRAYDERIRVFHEVRGVEQALIQQIVASVEPEYLVAMKDRNTGQFIGNVQNILEYLLVTYGKISASQLNEFDTEVSDMHYDPVTPVDTVFNKIEDLLEYGDMAICPFTQPQAMSKGYNILNKTGKFRESIKEWNRLPALQKTWINFKVHFRQAHAELKEIGALTMEEAGYGQAAQANMVNEIVTRVSEELHHQANLAFGTPPPEPPAPLLVPPATAAHATTDTILQQVLAQNQELMKMLAAKTPTSSSTNNRRPRSNASASKRGGQPIYPLPAWATEYCWTHGKCSHKSSKCRNPAPGHQEDATMEAKKDGSTFGCT